MTALELNAKKMELVKSIIDVNNEETLDKIATSMKRILRRREKEKYDPEQNILHEDFINQHTEEELLRSGYEAIQAYKNGELVPHEEVKRKYLL